LFKENPVVLVDKQFLLKEDGNVDFLYEVRFPKRNWEYLVRFEGCLEYVGSGNGGNAEEKQLR